jgi:hypothetical protein
MHFSTDELSLPFWMGGFATSYSCMIVMHLVGYGVFVIGLRVIGNVHI